MLILELVKHEEIVLTNRETGEEIARIVRLDRPNKIGFSAPRSKVAITREVTKRFETAGAAILER